MLSPGRKKKPKVSCIYPFRYPVLRSKPQRWIPELRFGNPPLRNSSKSFWEKLGIFLESLGGSQRQLCIKTQPLIEKGKDCRSWPDLITLSQVGTNQPTSCRPEGDNRDCPDKALLGPIGAFWAKPPLAKPAFSFLGFKPKGL